MYAYRNFFLCSVKSHLEDRLQVLELNLMCELCHLKLKGVKHLEKPHGG